MWVDYKSVEVEIDDSCIIIILIVIVYVVYTSFGFKKYLCVNEVLCILTPSIIPFQRILNI